MIKNLFRTVVPLCLILSMGSCDAFRTLSNPQKAALGAPYELIIVCSQPVWEGALGDSLRAVFTAPIPYLNQTEPMFDVLRVTERGYTNMIAEHRNILKIVVDPSLAEAAAGVQYDVASAPQIVVTLQGPSVVAVTDYLSTNRESMLQIFETAERDRDSSFAQRFNEKNLEKAIRETFGVEMAVPKGYVLAANEKDFLWARYEYPTASQGFFIYSYPYEGKESLSEAALLAARNKFATRIPGPSTGSYMITSDVFEPAYRMFRLEGRIWVELRGFWDVQGDFMGGPFVSFTTVDTATNRVFTVDGYVFSPKLPKRNLVRGVEHLLYQINFPNP